MEKQKFDFKYWLKMTTKELYLPLFIIFFVLLILQLCNLGTCVSWWLEAKGLDAKIMCSIGMVIPLLGTVALAYKGLYQYFKDLKEGKTR